MNILKVACSISSKTYSHCPRNKVPLQYSRITIYLQHQTLHCLQLQNVKRVPVSAISAQKPTSKLNHLVQIHIMYKIYQSQHQYLHLYLHLQLPLLRHSQPQIQILFHPNLPTPHNNQVLQLPTHYMTRTKNKINFLPYLSQLPRATQ